MFIYSLYLSHKKRNRHGLEPVYAKITINGIVHQRSSNCFVDPDQFDNSFKRLKPGTKDSEQINTKINRFDSLLADLTKQQEITISQIDDELRVILKPHLVQKKSQKTTFLKALDDYINAQEKEIVPKKRPGKIVKSTWDTYVYRRKNFANFFKSEGRTALPIAQFDSSLSAKFTAWCKKQEYSRDHINKHLKLARKLVREHNCNNNIASFKLPAAATQKIIYLTEQEVRSIKEYRFISSALQHTADLFVFQCYTGLSFADLSTTNFRKSIESYKGRDLISYTRFKTNVSGLLPVMYEARAVLNKYDYQLPKMTNQCYNRLLKEVASIVGINKHLTTHIGRKTFGTLMMDKGFTIEATTKMLAKTSAKETAKVYAEITQNRIIREMPSTMQPGLF
jgi:integrase/recombinase XerD